MIKKINTFPLIREIYRNNHQKKFAFIKLMNKNTDINKIFAFKKDANQSPKNGYNLFREQIIFTPFSNLLIYNNNNNNICFEFDHNTINPTYNNNIIHPLCKYKNSDYINRKFSNMQGEDTSNDTLHNKTKKKTLLFSWLKTVRKKQYYKIIGKLGIKKRNAGMYWEFYVNKRKKIRKKKRTI
ncbi:conserved Plasmodium protein, unknown function [Plasmodium berghei]|uniref:Uncharacterized protein n=2 Tax=Plasmodium berghei TaxID=5821 RepID=A0A509APQ4_PLABA|nr:conserved protein, unknown function [Plasmodium berghei ANKA]CXI89635.1 conserved Plasmodium protein, unknown function [Plasmodium berghei]SCL96101.1 conserved Plasmodium protein, unknown function [Plasmodium berghei]SCM16363.1 conserved Plasmodium protein, unknown function [Plasmodium berghei]SCM18157.1 conserved Plasmodium protein, unknown function [Plasmodium berghei]SCN27584.1 conserved Plasmodium protein, unknown function [Plasmodium berghei]|eukprot:XP_034423240.1 conserved protein, unknown function [Plasmodium berghei ANKA]